MVTHSRHIRDHVPRSAGRGSTYRRNPGRRAFSAFLSAVTRQPGLVTTGTDHCPGDRRPANSRRHQPSSLPNSIPYRLHHTAPNHDDGPSLPCFLSLSCLTLCLSVARQTHSLRLRRRALYVRSGNQSRSIRSHRVPHANASCLPLQSRPFLPASSAQLDSRKSLPSSRPPSSAPCARMSIGLMCDANTSLPSRLGAACPCPVRSPLCRRILVRAVESEECCDRTRQLAGA